MVNVLSNYNPSYSSTLLFITVLVTSPVLLTVTSLSNVDKATSYRYASTNKFSTGLGYQHSAKISFFCPNWML